MVYEFPNRDRSKLPLFGDSQLKELNQIAELVLRPIMPFGRDIHLLIRRANRAKGVSFGMFIDSRWLEDKDQLAFTLMHTIAQLSGIEDYNYPHGSYILYVASKQLSAHDIIQTRNEMALICTARNLDSVKLLQAYDKALSDHATKTQ